MSEIKWLFSNWRTTVHRVKSALLPHAGPVLDWLSDPSAGQAEIEQRVAHWVQAGARVLHARLRAAERDSDSRDSGFGIALSLLGNAPALTKRVTALRVALPASDDDRRNEVALQQTLSDFLRDEADKSSPLAKASTIKTWRRIDNVSEELQTLEGHARRWSLEHIESVFAALHTRYPDDHSIYFANLDTLVSWFARCLPADELDDDLAEALPLEEIPQHAGISHRLGERQLSPAEQASLAEELTMMKACIEAMPLRPREIIAVKLRLDLREYLPMLDWPITAKHYQETRSLSRQVFDRLAERAMAFLRLCFEERARRKETPLWEEP